MISTYFYILLASISIPFCFSFHPKIQFYKKWPAFIISSLIVSPLFIYWDVIFTKKGFWGFNSLHTADLNYFNLPLEEILFFLIIPYCCIFTYEVTQRIPIRKTYNLSLFQIIFGIILVLIALIYKEQSYTSITFFLLGILSICLCAQKNWLIKMYRSFLLLLFPFLIVNGLLTGTLITHEVVWYNKDEIFGFFVGTIPVEDAFYFLLLFSSQTLIYDYFKVKL